ncbi:helix-hairpin-helix domain-containing protein [Halorussus gelatinilyticus]|uniref:Helix-hairpin-helix domain-containing protein n=1 Tax=Halorussus gelatinilyticus TaxID=2937524 RepID=A0A8U0IIS9_9EURY|nr:helix-hairpin-helix domain-containing protein [Halorussus gelatinilyticus]UPW00172.1 helix-hairpin-helix domain-containing protein [Halorussus gelatinilyticus]
MSNEDAPDDVDPHAVERLTDIHFVGPATAEVLARAEFDATGIPEKTVSYEMLQDAGVNPGVATRLRKKHSLHWSFGGEEEDDDSLERRSEKVRGLQDGERAWVAASSGDWEDEDPEPTAEATTGGDWSPSDAESPASGEPAEATTDGSGAAEAAEAAWRERSRPDPVTDVPGVDDRIAEILANGGITSVRSLATADPEHVADSLELDSELVTEWRDAARDLA